MSTYLHYRNIIGKKYENMEKLFIERIFNDYSEKDLVESTQFLLVQIQYFVAGWTTKYLVDQNQTCGCFNKIISLIQQNYLVGQIYLIEPNI